MIIVADAGSKGVTADIGVTILRYIIMEPDVPSRTYPK